MLNNYLGDGEERKIFSPMSFKQKFHMLRQFEINPKWRWWVPCNFRYRVFAFIMSRIYTDICLCVESIKQAIYFFNKKLRWTLLKGSWNQAWTNRVVIECSLLIIIDVFTGVKYSREVHMNKNKHSSDATVSFWMS